MTYHIAIPSQHLFYKLSIIKIIIQCEQASIYNLLTIAAHNNVTIWYNITIFQILPRKILPSSSFCCILFIHCLIFWYGYVRGRLVLYTILGNDWMFYSKCKIPPVALKMLKPTSFYNSCSAADNLKP